MPLASLILLAAAAAAPIAPAHNWALDLFTPQGYRSMTLHGDEVRTLDADRVQVTDISIFVFSGTPANRITTILQSSSATFYSREDKASGTQGVRVIQGDSEITGRDWSFVRDGEKISIRGNVRVVLSAQIADMFR